MANAPVPGLSAAAKAQDVFQISYTAQSVNLVYGTVACLKTNGTDMDIVDPDNANAGPVLGLVSSQGNLTAGVFAGPAVGDAVNVQRFGRAAGLLAPNQTITRGDDLGASAGTLGQLAAFLPGQGMKYVGVAAQSKTSGATALYLEVDLAAAPVNNKVAMAASGFASTAPGAATKFLSAPGTGAGAAAAVPLFAVPSGGAQIRNLVASATTAPAGADTGIFTIQRSALAAGVYAAFADTTVTCTITGVAVEAKDIAHAVTVTEGDLLAIKCVSSGATIAGLSATFQFTK